MPKASRSTIRRVPDFLIGENLMGLRAVSRPELSRLYVVYAPQAARESPISATEKNHIQFYIIVRSTTRMKKNGRPLCVDAISWTMRLAAMEQMELYCEAHPGSPSAVRRPRLFVRGELWIALLGPSVEEGIVGIGSTVTAALRAFDAQYLAGLRPPAETLRTIDQRGARPLRLSDLYLEK